ncbi:MAG: hypothetical protein ACPGMX_08185, partial [Paracoccaceae bacterium]
PSKPACSFASVSRWYCGGVILPPICQPFTSQWCPDGSQAQTCHPPGTRSEKVRRPGRTGEAGSGETVIPTSLFSTGRAFP